MKPFTGIIQIPEARSGKLAIVHKVRPAGTRIPQCNVRTRLIGGHSAPDLVFDFDTKWHRLEDDDRGLWMTDDPIEQWQIDRELRGMRGNVLVGGLGLGYAATVLARRSTVRNVTVIENSPDVIKLVAPHIAHPKITVICADLFDWLKVTKSIEHSAPWNYAFYDIWQSDGLGTYFEMVRPLLAMSHGLVRNRPVCWNETVMYGQLHIQLFGQRVMMAQHGIIDELRAVTEWPFGWFGHFWRKHSPEVTDQEMNHWLISFMNEPFFTGKEKP
jgi:hypothetical protein